MKKACLIFGVLLAFTPPAFSAMPDSWALPEKRTVCSENSKYCLEVIPKKLESQLSYFEDKVDGKPNAGADKRTRKNYCRGVFYSRRANGSLQRLWETKLVNEVAPVTVLVSNQGDYVVTFDNWHSVGYGDDVIAIYKASDGTLVRNFGLSEFLTESDIHELPTSTSSIWWGGKHRIDIKKGYLMLQVTKGKRNFEKDAEYFEIPVDLSSGNVLDEKRDRLPSLQFVIRPTEIAVNGVVGDPAAKAVDCLDPDAGKMVASAELLKRAISRERPSYPAAARAVRATGQVTVAIRVASDGTTECAIAISGHPLLRATVTNAVKNWKFETSETGYFGFLTFEGSWALVAPDGTVIKDMP